jgi:hypothetical protein
VFVGHFGVGLAAKAFAPRASLGTLFLAAQFIDLLWPTLLLLGVERVRIDPGATYVTPLDFEHYPYSHSLAAVLLWAAGFALAYRALRRDRRGAIVLGIAVVSHWLLDAVVHRPDLPLYPGSSLLFGLGLWSTLAGTLAVEAGLFGAGLWLYLQSTAAVDATGKWALWGLAAVLASIYAANIFGPAPPGVGAIAWAGHAQWLLVAWGYWVDRHRRPRAPRESRPLRD